MTTNDDTADKGTAVEHLNFGAKTAKRVLWSEWEFTIVAPFTVAVTNASYGYLKEEHTYEVMVDEEGKPVSCTCPGFKHHYRPNNEAGKHMVALASVGGPTVLNAAVEYETPVRTCDSEPMTAADKLRADGGRLHAELDPTEEKACEDCLDDFPCFNCFEPEERC